MSKLIGIVFSDQMIQRMEKLIGDGRFLRKQELIRSFVMKGLDDEK